MNRHIFRAYDIRGVADRDLTDEVVRGLGQAIGTRTRRFVESAAATGPGRTARIALGRDCRTHSPRLHAALLQGLLRSGVEVIDIGVGASPLLYFAAHHLGTDGGVQITGSHNPPGDNGFKILLGGHSVHGAELEALRVQIEQRDFAQGLGVVSQTDVGAAYEAFVRERLSPGPRRFPVVVDAGNGTGGVLLAPLLRGLGFPVTELYCEMDGRFPHHLPDPTVPENLAALQARVAETGAELGIALDGDADRLAVVDRRGRIVWGDQLLLLFARAILAEQPGATFVCEVKSSQAVVDEITRAGGRAVMWRVGHSAIREKMRELGAALGGEMSGHLFFAHRYLGYDDAVYAAARLCELLSASDRPFEAHVDSLPRVHGSPEIRIPVPEPIKFEVARRTAAALRAMPGAEVLEIDGARAHLPDAWALVRASNTQAALVLRCEADTAARLDTLRAEIESIVTSAVTEVESARTRPTLTFYYDLSSPYSYLAAVQLPELAERTGATLVFQPILLGHLERAQQEGAPSPRSEARQRYVLADLQRWARRLKVPFHFASRHPLNTVQALRLCVQAQARSEAVHQALALRLFRAYWVDDLDLLDERTLARLVTEAGLPAGELLPGCARPEVRTALRDGTEAAITRGVFGAPSFLVGDELFWGSDRLDFVESALMQPPPEDAAPAEKEPAHG